MNGYTKALHHYINSKTFVRCFYGVCPDCGARIWSIDEDVENNKIKAKFICSCGKKYREVVYSPKLKKYKYQQGLVEQVKDPKRGKIAVIKYKGRYYLPVKDKVLSKPANSK